MIRSFCTALFVPALLLAGNFNQDDMKVFQRPSGWRYVKVLNRGNGFPTKSNCFAADEGTSEACKGTMIFRDDNTFQETIMIYGKAYNRSGTYQLEGDQITFMDELGTKDGPYRLTLDATKENLRYASQQAGVETGAELTCKKR